MASLEDVLKTATEPSFAQRLRAMSVPPPKPNAVNLSRLQDFLQQVVSTSPALQQLGLVAMRGQDPTGLYYSETYPRGEENSPNPSANVIEAYPKALNLPDAELSNLLRGESLHVAKREDPQYAQMRDQFTASYTPRQMDWFQRRYAEAKQSEGETRPFQDWMDNTWTDALIRGYLTPDANNEFRNGGFYTPEQEQILGNMGQYLGFPDASAP